MERGGRENQGSGDLTDRVAAYWSLRARGYSAATRISYMGETFLVEALGQMVDLGPRLRVADVGTGCGLMAMWLASLGHDVVAIDNSEAMLAEAGRNARDAGLDIEFRLSDAQAPLLEPGSYDLVVAKGCAWCLPRPLEAYSAWADALRPGGHLAIIDSNFYLAMFDEGFRAREERFGSPDDEEERLHVRTNEDGVDFGAMREMARELPLTRARRPTWDLAALVDLGMADVRMRSLDKVDPYALRDAGVDLLPESFIVTAQKPHRGMTPHDNAVYVPPPGADALDAAVDDIRGSGEGELRVLRALSSGAGMAIVRALAGRVMTTSELSAELGMSPSQVSHGLVALRECGVVSSVRDGKAVKHSISNAYVLGSVLGGCATLLAASRDNES